MMEAYILDAAEEIRAQYKRIAGQPLDADNRVFLQMVRQHLLCQGMRVSLLAIRWALWRQEGRV